MLPQPSILGLSPCRDQPVGVRVDSTFAGPGRIHPRLAPDLAHDLAFLRFREAYHSFRRGFCFGARYEDLQSSVRSLPRYQNTPSDGAGAEASVAAGTSSERLRLTSLPFVEHDEDQAAKQKTFHNYLLSSKEKRVVRGLPSASKDGAGGGAGTLLLAPIAADLFRIPISIAAEWDEYRMAYRSFRLGKARGSKGERPEKIVQSKMLAEFEGWAGEAQKARERRCDTVGVFDSGIGGLTVYRRLRDEYPHLNVIYFADMQRQPYGPRSQCQVASFCDQIMRFLQSQGAGVAVIACNTATAATFDNRINFKPCFETFPILGTIPYAAKAALNCIKKRSVRHIGVIATEGTVDSGAYARALTAFASARLRSCIVTSMPCPEFMRLAEAGDIWSEKTLRLTRQYMQSVKNPRVVKVKVGSAGTQVVAGTRGSHSESKAEVVGTDEVGFNPNLSVHMDTIIFGCTHYPLLADVCKKVVHVEFGRKQVKFIDPADALVDELKLLIVKGEEEEEGRGAPQSGWTRFCVNGGMEAFNERASRVLGYRVDCECVQLPPLEIGVKL